MAKKNPTIKIAIYSIFVAFLFAGIFCIISQRNKKVGADLGSIINYDASYSLSPEEHELSANIEFEWISGENDTLYFLLNKDLIIDDIHSISGNIGDLILVSEGNETQVQYELIVGPSETEHDFDHLALYAVPIISNIDSLTFSMEYSGEIFDSVAVPDFSRWGIADETTGLISDKGVFLTPWTGFYPTIPGESSLSLFRTTLYLPDNWEGLTEGNKIASDNDHLVFESGQPLDGCYLVAGPYQYKSIKAGDIEVAMYYYPESEDIVDNYLSASAEYIESYNEKFGEYAFNRFSVVENWFPTGYGMPSFTLLGTQVLHLPFIIYTSLGHEICHNWWGNGVLVDYESGNWCEGLTTYCADYDYKRQKGEKDARQYRLDLLRDYSDYITRGDEEDFPLSQFTSRTTAGTRTIGYGKSMMVFHMIENKIDSETFWQTLDAFYTEKQFTRVSWSDFFNVFSKASNISFDNFQEQWINKSGAPQLTVSNPTSIETKNRQAWIVEFDIGQQQEGDLYHLDVPVKITDNEGNISSHVLSDVHGRLYHARLEIKKQPKKVAIDPDFNIFRVLDPLEAPATFSGFYGADKPVVILPSGPMRDLYKQFAETLLGRSEYEILEDGADIPTDRSKLFISDDFYNYQETEKVIDILHESGSEVITKSLAIIAAFKDSNDPNIVNMIVAGASPETLLPLARRLPHYGKYSYLAFSSGHNVKKGQWDVTESPLTVLIP
jgi:Peptidase family M1 domain